MMALSSTLSFEGWDIQYALLEPETAAAGNNLINVVFIHGTPWSSAVFQPLAKALLVTNRYRILLYDLPGYGLSQSYSKPPDVQADSTTLFEGDTTIKFQSLALEELLKHLKLDGKEKNTKPAVIAHDIAGNIALRAHLLHGCEFARLMLWDTNTVLPWGDGFYKLVRSEPEVFLKMQPHIFEAVVRAVVQSGCYDPKKLVPGWEEGLVQAWIADGRQRSFVRQIAQANDADVEEMLDQNLYSKVRCPVKILWGEQDTWIPREKMDKLAAMLGHCLKGFVVVPNAGHLIMIDQPERVAMEVFEWLGEY